LQSDRLSRGHIFSSILERHSEAAMRKISGKLVLLRP
jgi:hypothetical protein